MVGPSLFSLNGAKSGFPQIAGWFKNQRELFAFSKQVLQLCLFGIMAAQSLLTPWLVSFFQAALSPERKEKKNSLSEVPLSIVHAVFNQKLRKDLGERCSEEAATPVGSYICICIYIYSEMVAPPSPIPRPCLLSFFAFLFFWLTVYCLYFAWNGRGQAGLIILPVMFWKRKTRHPNL